MTNSLRLFLQIIVFGIPVFGLLFLPIPFSHGAGVEEEWKAPARAAKRQNPIPADEKSIAAGKAIYTQQCYSCHGAQGKGNGPAAIALERSPGDLSKPKMWEQTDGALFWKITTGKKPMASYETILTEGQRWQVINYVRTLAPRPSENPPKSN